MTKEFGEIRIVYEEIPVGILLRENESGVVLEKYFDEDGQRVDVLHQFDEKFTLSNLECFEECLEEARQYEPDWNVPIFIKKNVKSDEEKKKQQEEKRAYFMRLVENTQLRPWEFFPRQTN